MKKTVGFFIAFLTVDFMGCFVWWMGPSVQQLTGSCNISIKPATISSAHKPAILTFNNANSTSPKTEHIPRNVVQLTPEEQKIVSHFKPSMSSKDLGMMMDLLTVFTNALKKANLSYMMYGGTLLGAYRHHGFIPWDDDVDLLMNDADKGKLKAAVSALSPVYVLVVSQKVRWKFFKNSSKMIRNLKWRWPFLDICFYKENANQIWDVDPGFKRLFTFQKKDIFPLQERPFENITLLAPKHTEKVLAKSYELSVCSTNTYNHKSEHFTDKKSQAKIGCDKLYEKFPFVFREKLKNGVNETLLLGNSLLKWHFIKE